MSGPRVYIASSWRNPLHDAVVTELKAAAIAHYNYREPAPGEAGFSWREIEESWQDWTTERYLSALRSPIAEAAYQRDLSGLYWANTLLLVCPSGRSAFWELGFAFGRGKRTIVLLADEGAAGFDLMIADSELVTTIADAIEAVRR